MNISRRVACVCLTSLLAYSAIAADRGWAQSMPLIASTIASTEPQSCFVSKARTLILPASLSMAQKGYLSELCDKVMRFHNRLLVANPMEQSMKLGATDLANAKLLYELDQQHVVNMSALIEQAVAVQPFPEDAFWIAWLNERRTYRDATGPLIRHQAEVILGTQPREE